MTCPTYPPGTPYDAALEMNKGWFERHDVEPGATAESKGRPNPVDLADAAP